MSKPKSIGTPIYMHKLTAHAVRNGDVIDISISGFLPNSCHMAVIDDFYPGGRRVYAVDPGAAQVFIKETVIKDLDILTTRCLMVLLPWGASISIKDPTHKKVEIFVNETEVLEVPVATEEGGFIVASLVGAKGNTGCTIFPEDAIIPMIYAKVFGPDTLQNCEKWKGENCTNLSLTAPADEQFIVVAKTGTNTGCRSYPEDAMYLAIYSKVYGPASYESCKKWKADNCDI